MTRIDKTLFIICQNSSILGWVRIRARNVLFIATIIISIFRGFSFLATTLSIKFLEETLKNEALKKECLSKIVEDNLLCGLGFSQLRREGNPMITATPIEGGYNIIGKVPWITGFDFFDVFMLGANLPDGREIRGIIPFTPSSQVRFSAPMKLGAMQSSNTVEAIFENYFLPSENVVSLAPAGAIHNNDKKVVIYPSFLVLGCAQAGLEIVKKVIRQRMQIYNGSFEDDLKLRVWAINLAQKCSKAALIVSSGAANYYHHPAQRVYKEARLFSVFAQTTDIMKASLEQLIIDSL